MPFKPDAFVEEAIDYVKKEVGNERAVIAASGGVDSTTTAVIAHRSLGKNLACIFVDTGLMRKGEAENVKTVFSFLGINVKIVDASDEFMKALRGVADPEKKRRIIGELFIRVFEREAKKTKARFLIQGTIAPDWIESGAGIRDTIKTHHNVGGVPADVDLKIVEPLKNLYKDEVRKVAKMLGIPETIYSRQPFPGPGLAVRILGEVTPERVDIVREACAIVEEEIEHARIDEKPWQYFAVLIPEKSVGVHGDLRAYGYVIVVRAVQSIDGMTARYSRIPHETLQKISLRITNVLKEHVNRVVYDVTDKPPATIEWE